ncbi:MAG: lysophospholipid acyltransferase family protein [Fidelibacterota bacterium]
MAKTRIESLRPRAKPLRYFLGYFALFLGACLAHIRVYGRHNLPDKGPFIIAINHFSRLDPAFIIYAIRRPVAFLMASDQAVEWFLWWAPWLYGYIPTNRTRLAPSTIKTALKVLTQGDILGIFPEGTSTADEIRPAKSGAVYLSAITGAKIVPVSILGLSVAWENWFRGVRPTVTIRIGKPFGPVSLPENRKEKIKALADIGDELMSRIATLLPKKHRGYLRNKSL